MFKSLRKFRRTGKATSFQASGPGQHESAAPPRIEQQPDRRFLIRQSIAQLEEAYGPVSESIIARDRKTRVPLACRKDE
jgi:hypothetical protein